MLGCRSWMDCLAARLVLNSCFCGHCHCHEFSTTVLLLLPDRRCTESPVCKMNVAVFFSSTSCCRRGWCVANLLLATQFFFLLSAYRASLQYNYAQPSGLQDSSCRFVMVLHLLVPHHLNIYCSGGGRSFWECMENAKLGIDTLTPRLRIQVFTG